MAMQITRRSYILNEFTNIHIHTFKFGGAYYNKYHVVTNAEQAELDRQHLGISGYENHGLNPDFTHRLLDPVHGFPTLEVARSMSRIVAYDYKKFQDDLNAKQRTSIRSFINPI